MNREEREGKKENLKGRVKEATGALTGDEELREKGSAEREEGEARETLGKARRKLGEAVEDLGKQIKRS